MRYLARRVNLNFALVFACVLGGFLVSPTATADDLYQSRYEQLLQTNDVGVVYNQVTRMAVEGVSWVRHIYGAAEYLLLGAPALTLRLLGSGPLGLIEKVSWDVAEEMMKEVFQHPESASKKIAKAAYDIGLKAYRENYRLYAQYRERGHFSDEEARNFVVNWFVQDYMGAAKLFYNAITAYEGKTTLAKTAN